MTKLHSDAIARLEQALREDRDKLTQAFSSFRDNLTVGAVLSEGGDLAKEALAEGTAKAKAALSEGAGVARAVFDAKAGQARAALGEGAELAQHYLGPKVEGAKEAIGRHPVLTGAVGLGLGYLLVKGLRRPAAEQAPEYSKETLEAAPWLAEADDLRERAAQLLAQIDEAIDKGQARVEDLADSREEVLEALTTSLRDLMSRDLADLGEDLRAQALEAREAAYREWVIGRGEAAEAGHKPSGAVITVLAAAAGGVVLAALLPRLVNKAGPLGDWLQGAKDRVGHQASKVGGEFSHELVENVMAALKARK